MSRTAQPRPPSSKPFYDLVGFARLFIRTHSITHHRDVHTEDLVEAFRHHMDLSPFPTLDELLQLSRDLEIELGDLPKGSRLPGANTSYGSTDALFLARGLPTWFAESTAGHELREIIERALKRANPTYQALDTSNNKEMHGESEYFALCLLMQAKATNERLREVGYDVVRFATERKRSLPSVIMRAQTIYKAGGTWTGPVAGLWIFDAGTRSTVSVEALKVKYRASLCGFSTNKGASAFARNANALFPKLGSAAKDFEIARDVIQRGKPVLGEVPPQDLFGQEAYTVLAEPLFVGEQMRRVIVAAVRRDCLSMVDPWLARLGLNSR